MNINATLFVQMVVFFTFVEIARRKIWPHLIQVIDERQANIEKGIQDAKQAAKALALAEDESRSIIKNAQQKHREILAQAEEMAREVVEDAHIAAKKLKADALLEAKDTISQQMLVKERLLQKRTLSFVENVLHKVIVKLPDQPQLETMIESAIGDVNDAHQ